MRKLRVLALVHHELMPPKDPGQYDTNVEWKMEYDVIETLERSGYEVEVVGLHANLRVLAAGIDRFRPQVLFNLLEDFHGVAVNDQHLVSHLELFGHPLYGMQRARTLARARQSDFQEDPRL